MTNVLHVHPENDLIDHDTSTSEPDCPCGPQVKPIEREDGSMGWLLIHNSLDNREARERAEAAGE